jgi:hypothetical protein
MLAGAADAGVTRVDATMRALAAVRTPTRRLAGTCTASR